MTVLQVDALRARLGEREIGGGLTFHAARGELVALMGPSGAGKTTVLRAIAGLQPLSHGRIEVDGVTMEAGHPLPRGQRAILHRRVGVVFQFHHLFANLTALANVTLAPIHVLKQSPAQAQARSRALLTALGVVDRAHAFPHELSGGEAQRVAIARALAVDPPVLLMDEPTASLDPARRTELAATLNALCAEGRTIVMATHDEEFVRTCAHRVITVR